MFSTKNERRKRRLRDLLNKYQRKLRNGSGTKEQREYWRYAVAQCQRALKEK